MKLSQYNGQAGQASKNGELLKLALSKYDAFITADQNMQYQQNPGTLPLAVFVLAAHSTAFVDLVPLMPGLLKRLSDHQPRTLIRTEA